MPRPDTDSTQPTSYAGISVPDGDPEQIRAAATTFRQAGQGLQGIATDVRGVPGLVGDWRGPASAKYHGTTVTNGTALDEAVTAMASAEQAATTYADALDKAQKDARAAITSAISAQGRIDDANSRIADAASRQRTAQTNIDTARNTIAAHSWAGTPSPTADAQLLSASTDLSTAQSDATTAGTSLTRASDDLDDAKTAGATAAQDALDAATAATGAFQGLAGGTPIAAVFGGSPEAVGNTILARVRAGDFSALDGVPLNYLPPRIQSQIGASLADQAYKLSTEPEKHRQFEALANAIAQHTDDPDLATGFYNELGGVKANQLGQSIAWFQAPQGNGWYDPGVTSAFHPFSALLATATASGALRGDFADDFFGPPTEVHDRLGQHPWEIAFLMSGGAAAAYGSKFLARAGQEFLIDPYDATTNPNSGPLYPDDDDYQFMDYMAGNPEASGLLLSGHHGKDNYFSNAGLLFNQAIGSADDSSALGHMVTAATHDLRSTDLSLANSAAHEVIKAAPIMDGHVPDGLKDPLTTVLDDHIKDFEHAATVYGTGGDWPGPADGINGLTYDEGHDYLKTLLGDDGMRGRSTEIIGNRVAEDLFNGVAHDSQQDLTNGGSLSQMGVMATADADMSAADRQDTMNGMATTAGNKLVGLIPTSKIPGGNVITSQIAKAAFGEMFPTDNVEHAWDVREGSQVVSYNHIKKLISDAQIATGEMPSQLGDIIRADGTVDLSHAQDVIQVNGHDLAWDLNHDGVIEGDENHVTVQALADAATGPTESAQNAASSLHQTVYDAHHLPDVDDLPMPKGYDQANPNWFEGLAPWQTHGEDGFTGPGGIDYNDVSTHYDASEHVLVVNAKGDGHEVDLHYVNDNGTWKVAQWDGEQWRPTP
jgi:hypothetical protein